MFSRALSGLAVGFATLLLVATSAATAYSAALKADPPVTSAEEFVQVCTTKLALTEDQREGMKSYLEQEIEYMNVQATNHSAAEVAELIPAEREQLQRVAGHLLSPGQLRQFRELEATPKMRDFLRRMALAE